MSPEELKEKMWESFREGYENGRLFGHSTAVDDSRPDFELWYRTVYEEKEDSK